MVIEKRSGDICDGCMDEFWLVQPGEHECLEKDCGCNLHCDTEKPIPQCQVTTLYAVGLTKLVVSVKTQRRIKRR